jgi:hypothetical protein
MRDPSDPPRQHFKLKPKEFESVNTTGPAASDSSLPTDVDAHFQAANAALPIARPSQPAATNDVHVVLRENLARANAAGVNELSVRPPKRSRRKRDYWCLTIGSSLVLVGIAIVTGPQQAIPFTCAIAGLGIVNATLWWVMWHIMDDY